MELVNTAVFGLLSIASLVIFVIVLIKSFKEGGVLHGILGILTCGLYTYIWGWLKSKQLQLTKMMLLWTIVWVLSFALPIIVGTSALMQIIPMASELGIVEQPLKKMKAAKSSGAPTRRGGSRMHVDYHCDDITNDSLMY